MTTLEEVLYEEVQIFRQHKQDGSLEVALRRFMARINDGVGACE